jgi:hypothetical protein
LALRSGRGIIPVYIGGTDKYGLGKRDPWTAFNHREKYLYRIQRGEEISPGNYGTMAESRAVRRLTEKIRNFFLYPPTSSWGGT